MPFILLLPKFCNGSITVFVTLYNANVKAVASLHCASLKAAAGKCVFDIYCDIAPCSADDFDFC